MGNAIYRFERSDYQQWPYVENWNLIPPQSPEITANYPHQILQSNSVSYKRLAITTGRFYIVVVRTETTVQAKLVSEETTESFSLTSPYTEWDSSSTTLAGNAIQQITTYDYTEPITLPTDEEQLQNLLNMIHRSNVDIYNEDFSEVLFEANVIPSTEEMAKKRVRNARHKGESFNRSKSAKYKNDASWKRVNL